MRTARSTVALSAICLVATCGGNPVSDSVEMTRTIDVLSAIGAGDLGTDVTGFYLGNELDSPFLTEASWTAEYRTLPAAGSESPPCNDGTAYELRKVGGRTPYDLFEVVQVIGDTGDGDISDDRDCGCDAHVSLLQFNELRIEPAPPYFGFDNLELGKEALCPNRLDDLVLGDGHFAGSVGVDLSATLRVVDGGLFLDVTYFARNAP